MAVGDRPKMSPERARFHVGLGGKRRPALQGLGDRVPPAQLREGTFSWLPAGIMRLQGHLVPPGFATQASPGEGRPQLRGQGAGAPSRLHGRDSDRGHPQGSRGPTWRNLALQVPPGVMTRL